MINQVLQEEFKIIKKIHKGSFTQIFEALNIKNGNSLAIKVENFQQKDSKLNYEAKFLYILSSENLTIDHGVPQMYFIGKQGKYNILVMDLLGPSLQQLLKQCNGTFRLKTVLMIANQMVKRIQYIHNKGIIHRNIRPSNFLFGLGQRRKKLYLIDFSQAKKYMKNNEHIPYRQNKKMVGSLRYSSINSHLGIQVTRRDDLESMVFCWVQFLYGHLPWQGIQSINKSEKNDKVLSKKIENRSDLIFKNQHPNFTAILDHIRNLTFEQQPDYKMILNKIIQVRQQNQIQHDFHYDWDELMEQKNKFEGDTTNK